MAESQDIINRLKVIALEHCVCPRCEADPKEECITLSREEASDMHSSRVQPLMQAYVLGVNDTKAEFTAKVDEVLP